MAVRSAGAVWGLLALYRPTGSREFTPADADFVPRHLRPPRARVACRADSPGRRGSRRQHGPAVIVVDAHNHIQLASPAVWERIAELGGTDDRLPLPLLSTIAATRTMNSTTASTAPRTRTRTARGRWLVLHAAPLAGPDATAGQVVLTIEDARPPEILPLIITAFGLTDREQDVTHRVLRGADIAEIAQALHLSPHTVQDHLKSTFNKTGVSSRKELTAQIFLQQHATQLGTLQPARTAVLGRIRSEKNKAAGDTPLPDDRTRK